jgi:two-component system sensor histidine kinase VicK
MEAGSPVPGIKRRRPHPPYSASTLGDLFERFPASVVGVDDELRVVYANARARRLLHDGVALEAGLADDELRALAERLVALPVPLPATTVRLTDGRSLRVSGVAASESQPALLILEDVSEHEKKEQAARDFVRNAAHQLRTPLTAIATAVEVLESGAKDDPVQRDQFLANIRMHSERLTRLGRSLLVLARAQSGEPPRLDFVELQPILRALAMQAEPRAGVEIVVECAPGLAALAERDLVREALAALVDNAVAQTWEGRIALRAGETNGTVAVIVEDSGVGILPEHRARVVEPFYRTTSSGVGFGLGLAIAAQAVRAMDGTLTLEGGEGTRFVIRLPSARVR